MFKTSAFNKHLSKIKSLEGPKFNIDFGGRGGSRQGEGISISTMQKGAVLRECVNTCPSLAECKIVLLRTQVEPCMTLILTEIKGINDIIMLLVVGVT